MLRKARAQWGNLRSLQPLGNQTSGLVFSLGLLSFCLHLCVMWWFWLETVEGYYTYFKDTHPMDYQRHRLCFFLYTIFLALFILFAVWIMGLALTYGLALTANLLAWSYSVVDFFIRNRPGPNPLSMHKMMRLSPRYEEVYQCGDDVSSDSDTDLEQPGSRSRLGPRTWRQKINPALVLMCVVSSTVLVFVTLENKLLAEMSVHLIDFDLMDAIGIKRVLDRQRQLGAGIDSSHTKYVPYVALILVLWTVAQYYTATYIWTKHNATVRKLFPRMFVALVVMLIVTRVDVYMLEEKVWDYKGVLPFNFLGISEKRIIHVNVEPKLTPLGEAMKLHAEGKPFGYPTKDDTPIVVQNKKNIIFIITESAREDFINRNNSANILNWAAEPSSNCIQPKRHMPNAHVTEMSMFSLFYGLNPYHLLPFGYNYVNTFAFDTLHKNGYYIADYASSTMWLYPNAHITEQMDHYGKQESDQEVEDKVEQFLKDRDVDGRPFFLFLFLEDEPKDIITPNGTDQQEYLRDKRKMSIINRLDAHGQLKDKSMVIITSDHGDMLGEHGELGHGQREGSWWTEKMSLKTFVCIPGTPTKQYNMAPTFASHQDFVPTYFDFLDLKPKVPSEIFSTGRTLLQPANEDWTTNRFIYATPRYFPYKNKLLMVADKDRKFWYRVSSLGDDGHLNFAPELSTDWADKEVCTTQDMRNAFGLQMACVRSGGTLEKCATQAQGTQCPYAKDMVRYLDHLDRVEFWRFLQPKKET
eukprot:comp12477_c0_seq1/m.7421 comp12477_c0_seq1/g.7421  ORF comp12477_c0_seq1/g.7421 comp12477_c0_seq1/m.7421 type:complete len:752 (-) comp12477_c0_seq1:643-2898(-)